MSKKPYQLYIDGMEIPITPAKIKNKIPGQNDFYDLVNGETYTVLRKSKLAEYSFSFYAFSDEHEGVDLYIPQQEIISKLEELKKEKKIFEFVILRITSDPNLRNSICKYMTLEDYVIDEDSKIGTNILIDLTLKEYQPLKTVKLKDTGSSTDKRQVNKIVKTAIAAIPLTVPVVAKTFFNPNNVYKLVRGIKNEAK
ncbi:peptidoglycan-binding LysM [Peptoniphilus sp. SGI.035]|uniref:peptidoglycan-binding LysM n=1 Tax=unclassified Peptoniphilus TaxID=2637196 RepID=UPI002A80525C|nr:peptidoglycan-binding LysM [Peptoniphilus sp.]MDY3902455.1 peptidoglycan-binding LysM [Peptoniphilus sp.]